LSVLYKKKSHKPEILNTLFSRLQMPFKMKRWLIRL